MQINAEVTGRLSESLGGVRIVKSYVAEKREELVFAKGASLGDFELLQPAVYVLAGLSVITVAQRIWHVRRELSVPSGPSSGRRAAMWRCS